MAGAVGPRVLAIASGGGHWTQLLRVRAALDHAEVVYASTIPGLGEAAGLSDFRVVPDANRWQKLRLIRCALAVLVLLVRVRPKLVISTGAAPGVLAVRLAPLVGARTIWIDSIANADELSMSGRHAAGHVDLCLTQWEHLADPPRIQWAGSVLGATSAVEDHDDHRIFVTVGTELPFDRLVHAVDRWADLSGRAREVFAQTGETRDPPLHISWAPYLEPAEFQRRFEQADLIIAHAGMGTILASLQGRRPLLVMPRRAALGEQRNDHQLATARRLGGRGFVDVAFDEQELFCHLLADDVEPPEDGIGADADTSMLERLRASIDEFPRRRRSAHRTGALVAEPGLVVAASDREASPSTADGRDRGEHDQLGDQTGGAAGERQQVANRGS